MRIMGLTCVDDPEPIQKSHRFGNYDEDQPTLFSVKFPFNLRSLNKKTAAFNIRLDVIAGGLPFLIGLPDVACTECVAEPREDDNWHEN